MPRRYRLARHPVLTQREAHIPGLDPRLDGVRIAHLTDIHVGRLTPESHVRGAVQLANDSGAEVVALTGDYVCWSRSEVVQMREQLRGFRAPTVATLGNHDYFTSPEDVASGLTDNGYHVLRNQHVTLDVRGAPLHLVGIDDPVTRNDDVDGAFSAVPDGGACVALAHCPEAADRIADRGAQMILSGHTHGGQIWLRGVSDKIFYGRMKRRYRVGLYSIGMSKLYVGAGVGYSGVRARVGPGTRSEVAIITLRRAQNGHGTFAGR